jgi:hypothetical protein
MLCTLETWSTSLFFGSFLPSSAQSFATCFAEVFTQSLWLVCEVVWIGF